MFLPASEFFNNDIPPLLFGAFFSRYVFSDDKKYIYTLGDFKKSKYINDNEFNIDDYYQRYVDSLNKFSKPYKNWLLKNDIKGDLKLPRGRYFFILSNDLDLDEKSFYNKLYHKLLSECDWLYDDDLNSQKKDFIRGFMELRGSIDTNAPYIAQDYFYFSKFEIKKARLFIDYLNVPCDVLNLNFRELQNQFVSGIRKRNTQLRFNVFWYATNIGFINEYKMKIYAVTKSDSKSSVKDGVYYFADEHNVNRNETKRAQIEQRLNFYFDKVKGEKLSGDSIAKLRTQLGFDKGTESVRSYTLREYVRETTPDECVACKNKYDVMDRTFISKRTGKPYLEIHHVISLGGKKELDDEENMVKLCSTCHNALRNGAARREYQLELIEEIYENAPHTFEFAKHFFDTEEKSEIFDKTYENLK